MHRFTVEIPVRISVMAQWERQVLQPKFIPETHMAGENQVPNLFQPPCTLCDARMCLSPFWVVSSPGHPSQGCRCSYSASGYSAVGLKVLPG